MTIPTSKIREAASMLRQWKSIFQFPSTLKGAIRHYAQRKGMENETQGLVLYNFMVTWMRNAARLVVDKRPR